MATFAVETTINTPVQEVWRVLADIGNIHRWNPGVVESHLTGDQAEGVGACRTCDLGRNNFLDEKNLFQSESYLNYQGLKLVNRFDANSFLTITRIIDRHDLSRGRVELADVMASIKAKALCIGIDTDILYPAHEQQEIVQMLIDARYFEIKSPDGHDAFLIEFEQMSRAIKPFLDSIVEEK